MSNKRILIVTGFTHQSLDIYVQGGDIPIKNIAELTFPSKYKYANKYGYDLLNIQDLGEDKDKNFTKENIGFLRVSRTADMLKYYDIVLWIDADSIITNDSIRIEDFPLEEHITFYASYDWNGRYSISAGNFMFYKNQYTEVFLQTLYNLGKQVENEQVAMNVLSRNPQYMQIMKILDHHFLNSAPTREMYAEQWETRPDIPYPWNEKSFLCHLTGASNKHRDRILKTYFKQYL